MIKNRVTAEAIRKQKAPLTKADLIQQEYEVLILAILAEDEDTLEVYEDISSEVRQVLIEDGFTVIRNSDQVSFRDFGLEWIVSW